MSTRETLIQFAKASKESLPQGSVGLETKQPRTSWIVIVCAIMIAIACIANTVHNIWFVDNKQVPMFEQEYDDYPIPSVMDSVSTDTVVLNPVISN